MGEGREYPHQSSIQKKKIIDGCNLTMNVKSELQTLLKDSYTVINDLQRVASMADVKKELKRQSDQTLTKLEGFKSYLHGVVDSFELRARNMVDTITSCKVKTLESHCEEVLQCLEYLTKMCVITEDLLKVQNDSESVMDFAPKLKEELANGLTGCKELSHIDYDLFASLDLKFDTSWLFETPFLKIISKSSQSQSESTLCSLGFGDDSNIENCRNNILQMDCQNLETDFDKNLLHDRDQERKYKFCNQKNMLSTIPEASEVDMSPVSCKTGVNDMEEELEVESTICPSDSCHLKGKSNEGENVDEIIKLLDAELGGLLDAETGVTDSEFCHSKEEKSVEVKSPLSSSLQNLNLEDQSHISRENVKNSLCTDYHGAGTSLQIQALSSVDIEDVVIVSESECEEIDCDILKPLDVEKEITSNEGNLSPEKSKSETEDDHVMKVDDLTEYELQTTCISSSKTTESKPGVKNDFDGSVLCPTQMATESNIALEIARPESNQPNNVPCHEERPVSLNTADQAAECKKETAECKLETVESEIETAECERETGSSCSFNHAAELESHNKSIFNPTIPEVSAPEQNQDFHFSKTYVNLNYLQSMAKTSFPKGILTAPQFSCGGPLDMHFDIGSAVAWNRFGKAEINAVFIKKITGGHNAYFEFPIGCCVMKNGCVVVADTGNHVVKILQDDCLQMLIGKNDGIIFIRPSAVVVDANDNIYVKDDTCVQIFNSQGKHMRTVGKRIFKHPYGLALTNLPRHGPTLFVLDATMGNPKLHRYLINEDRLQSCEYTPLIFYATQASKLRFFAIHKDKILASDLGASTMYLTNLDGQFLGKFGSPGTQNGQFVEPSGVASDAVGNWLVADSKNNRVQVFNSTGKFMTPVKFSQPIRRPSGIHLTSDGTLYVINYLEPCIKVYSLKSQMKGNI